MALEVRISGPEFLSEENMIAFLRIEESIRQYTAHSREPIYLIRRPLSLSEDHFVLLWPRGYALAGMYPYSGSVRGSAHGNWSVEQPVDSDPSRHSSTQQSRQHRDEHSIHALENPYRSLEEGARELAELLEQSVEKKLSTGTRPDRNKNDREAEKYFPSIAAPDGPPPDATHVALFTGAAVHVDFEDETGNETPRRENTTFQVMTVEQAISRSIVHLPNLLRVADRGKVVFSNPQLASISELLDHSAQFHSQLKETIEVHDNGASIGKVRPSSEFNKPRHISRNWFIVALIIAIVVGFYVIKSVVADHSSQAADTTAVAQNRPHPPSEMIIKIPFETQLFVSEQQYRTRSELDEALAQGEGQRYLPDTEQVIVMDSTTLAKGVYGYFKIDNAWRKGKLLQTLEPVDTVTIVKFLDPLP